MAEQKIEIGQIFTGSELGEKLPEDHGIVIVIRNDQEVAYGHALKLPYENDTLGKNFVGAKFVYGAEKVFLIEKRNGIITRRNG